MKGNLFLVSSKERRGLNSLALIQETLMKDSGKEMSKMVRESRSGKPMAQYISENGLMTSPTAMESSLRPMVMFTRANGSMGELMAMGLLFNSHHLALNCVTHTRENGSTVKSMEKAQKLGKMERSMKESTRREKSMEKDHFF